MKGRGSRRLIRGLGLALAIAAFAAPSAQAVVPGDGPGGPGSTRLYADDVHVSLVSSGPSVPAKAGLKEKSSEFGWSDAVIGVGAVLVLLGFGATIFAARQARGGRPAAV